MSHDYPRLLNKSDYKKDDFISSRRVSKMAGRTKLPSHVGLKEVALTSKGEVSIRAYRSALEALERLIEPETYRDEDGVLRSYGTGRVCFDSYRPERLEGDMGRSLSEEEIGTFLLKTGRIAVPKSHADEIANECAEIAYGLSEVNEGLDQLHEKLTKEIRMLDRRKAST